MTIALDRQNVPISDEPEDPTIPGVLRAITMWNRMGEGFWSPENPSQERSIIGQSVTGDITNRHWDDIIPRIMGSQTINPMMTFIRQEGIHHLISPCHRQVIDKLSTMKESYEVQVFSDCDKRWSPVEIVDDRITAYHLVKSFAASGDRVRVRSILK